ncbi:MAG: peptidoglycan-binding protein [Lachnospiraceae bacterium]|nr:peptidoglycan-binding protein [Clostridia bacterium]MBR1691183.1 peptidoglycan-binding protein [Lachnospiraceae bacterium]
MELKPYTQPAKKNAKKTAVSAAITGAVSRETLRFGSRGNAVKTLQETLGGLTVDGIFGQETRAAVKEFQEANGLTVDGIVGPQTWNALLGG